MAETPPQHSIDPLTVEALTLDEKVRLVSGKDTWQTADVDRVGLGAVKVTDGPNGARGDSSTGATAVCLPASIAVGASFDVELVAELGALLGRETARKGAQVLLGPTINLARHPLGGRNFESFGEDPFLTSQLAAAYIKGVQSEGVGACAKHFVANDVEYARMTVSSEVEENVLREVYLAPFEAAIGAGVWTVMAAYPMLNGVHCVENEWLLTTLLRDEWGFDGLVMSDWNATRHRSRPINAGLDLEMPGPALALGDKLLTAIEGGEVAVDVLDKRVARVIDLAERTGRTSAEGAPAELAEQSIDLPEERALAKRAAADGMVLLSNDATLPLAPESMSTVAITGPNATTAVIQGGGSAQVPTHYTIDPIEGLVTAVGADRVDATIGCLSHRYLPPVPEEQWVAESTGSDGPLRRDDLDSIDGELIESSGRRQVLALMIGSRPPGVTAMRWTGTLRIDDTGTHRFGVVAVGQARVFVDAELVVDNWTAPRPGDDFFQFGSEQVIGVIDLEAGSTVDIVVEWAMSDHAPLHGIRFGYLPPVDEDAMLEEAVVSAAGADVAVVVVGLNNQWETEGHDRASFSLPGRQDELIRRVASANERTIVVVNAGGPIAMPWFDDVSAVLVAWYPGQEFGAALTDVLLGESEPGGRLPITWPRALEETPFELPIPEPGPPRPGAVLPYSEGFDIGYRSYHRNGITPLAAFGFGLGYTTFTLGQPEATTPDDPGGAVEIAVPVANTGTRAGKCVVQAYIDNGTGTDRDPADTDAADRHPRPSIALAGFSTVHVEAGSTGTATIEVPARAFQSWSPESKRWVDPGGERTAVVGLSSADAAHRITIARTPT